MNFRVATFGGTSVLTWWEGKTENGLGRRDARHRRLELPRSSPVSRPPAGSPSDLHEFLLTPSGTLLLTAWEIVETRPASVGGPAQREGRRRRRPGARPARAASVLFEWHSLDHVALDESHAGVGDPFDYFHINSIAPTDDGNLLVSARNTWAVYKIDRGSGEVIWRLGGKKQRLPDGRRTRSLPGSTTPAPARRTASLSLFDDGAAPAGAAAVTRARARARHDADARDAPSRLPAHPAGARPRARQHPAARRTATSSSATGRRRTSPSSARAARCFSTRRCRRRARTTVRSASRGSGGRSTARRSSLSSITGTDQLYVSWNGATEVDTWQLRTGPSGTGLERRGARAAHRVRDDVPSACRRPVRRGRRARRARARARNVGDDHALTPA